MRGLKKLFVILLAIMILTDVCLSSELKKKKKTKKGGSAKKKPIQIPKEGKVITLSDDNFDEMTKTGIWFVKFYAPWCGYSKGIASQWKELGRVSGNTINIGEVDCSVNPVTAKRFNVEKYPTLYLFGEGLEPVSYSGAHNVRNWLTFVSDAIKTKIKMVNGNDQIEQMYKKLKADAAEDERMSRNSDVLVVTSETLDEELKKGPLLVNFYATWCDHCKDLRPIWEAFASYAKSNNKPYRVAKVNTAKDHDIASKYHVKGFPTIMFFKEGKQPVSYLGERSLAALVDYADSKMRPNPFDEL